MGKTVEMEIEELKAQARAELYKPNDPNSNFDTSDHMGSLWLNKDKLAGCPFCGNKNIEYSESHGENANKEKSISIQSTCYVCHTVKYIAYIMPVSKYLDENGKVIPSEKEKYAGYAIKAWNERPKEGILPGEAAVEQK